MHLTSISLSKLLALTLMLILHFFLSSCNKNSEEIYNYPNVDERLHEYFKRFEEEGEKRGLKIDLRKSNITGSIAKINVSGIVGLCNSNGNNKVIIDEDFWARSSYSSKELIIFHELGHCYLQLPHNTNISKGGICKSIMRPGNGSCLDFYNAKTRVKLIDELFFN